MNTLQKLLDEQAELKARQTILELEHLACRRRLNVIEPKIHQLRLKTLVGTKLAVVFISQQGQFKKYAGQSFRLIDIKGTKGTIQAEVEAEKICVQIAWLKPADGSAVTE